MKFTNLDIKKNYMEEECERLRLNITELLRTRDTVLSEILDQRRGKQEVALQWISLQNEVFSLETHLNTTLRALNESSAHFYALTDKQRAKIEELNSNISDRLSELAIQEWKEIIDIDSENIKYKKELSKTRQELQDMKDSISDMNDQKEFFDKQVEETESLFSERSDYLDRSQKALELKDKALNLKETRLDKLKIELTK